MPQIVEIHRHARQRCRERGATITEVTQAVLGGQKKPVKLGRFMFSRIYPFGKIWLGRRYRQKKLEVIAVQRPNGAWLALTVIVKYF